MWRQQTAAPPLLADVSYRRISLPHDVPFIGACTASNRHLVAHPATASARSSMRLSAINGLPSLSGMILDRDALSDACGPSWSTPCEAQKMRLYQTVLDGLSPRKGVDLRDLKPSGRAGDPTPGTFATPTRCHISALKESLDCHGIDWTVTS